MIEISYCLWDMENRCIIEEEKHIYVPDDTTIEQALAMMCVEGFLPIKISNLHFLRRE